MMIHLLTGVGCERISRIEKLVVALSMHCFPYSARR